MKITPLRIILQICMFAALVLAWSYWQAKADVIITYDEGGNIGEYGNHYAHLRETGEKIIIDGYCGSSCTMALSANYCVTPRAMLGFHKAYYINFYFFKWPDPVDTAYLWSAYPKSVRDWINSHGGLAYEIKLLKGEDMLRILKHC